MNRLLACCLAVAILASGCSLFPRAHWDSDVGRRCVEECDRKADWAISDYCKPNDALCARPYNADRHACWKACPGVTVTKGALSLGSE